MRRLVNFLLILVVLAAVGFLLVKAKIVKVPGGTSRPEPNPIAVPAAPREHLRVSVAHRPEGLILGALGRMLEVDGLKLEVVPFDPESTWIELAAGEVDLVVAPIPDAVTAQARFNCGRFLFVSGLSEGYDAIFAKAAPQGPLKSLGIVTGRTEELFALANFPEAKLMAADSPPQLQAWLNQGAVQGAVLESALVDGALAEKMIKLGGTSADAPMPTVAVLSRSLAQETADNKARLDVLAAALQTWGTLIGYLTDRPELLRTTLREDAQEIGVDLERLLKDYRFLSPKEGRQALLHGAEEGLLKQTLDLLVLAKTSNLTAPDWEKALELPSPIEKQLNPPGDLQATSLPTPAVTASASLSPTPSSPEPKSPTSALGSFHLTGALPVSPWPKAKSWKVPKVQPFPPALTAQHVGVATASGFSAYTVAGELAFNSDSGGPTVCDVLSDPSTFYVTRTGRLEALDPQGKPLWSFEFEGSARSKPLLTPRDLVMTVSSATEHKLLAVARETGNLSWQVSLPNAPAGPPAYLDTASASVILVDSSGQLSAWGAEKGEPLWRSSVPKATSLVPSSLGDVVAVADPQGGLALMSAIDGQQLWATQLGSPIAVPPTITTGSVLVAGQDSTLYALGRSDGQIQSKLALDAPISSPVLILDNQALVCDGSGRVQGVTFQDKLAVEWSEQPSKKALLGPIFSAQNFVILDADGSLFVYPR